MVDQLRQFKTTNEYVYYYLKRWILDGTLKPGEKLEQDWIAAKLGASRMPVRTALERLAGEYLVVLEPHRGAMVTALSRAEVEHIYAVRERLEPWAIELVAPRLTAADYTRAHELAELGARHVADKQWTLYLEANHEFYALLWKASGNPVLIRIIAQLFERALRYRWLLMHTVGLAPEAVLTSKGILRRLEQGDAAGAGECLRVGLQAAKAAILDFLHAPPQR